uniref:SGNH hydrolase-type esterase domain-containing protein n=1 Tax=Myripristis murdjan TaxID=586833 RepID=A0A667Z3U5_9TELE
MPPLTSPGCDGCLRLTQRISELEGRMSTLYQLREEEQIIDSMVVAVGLAASSATAREMDSTVPLPCADVAAASTTEHWSRLGAKPKALVSSTPCQKELPTTLVIGDSIIRNVRRKSAKCFCFPGAKVADITEKCISLLAKYPRARSIIIHIGCNNVPEQGSEILKQDFLKLFDSLKDCGRRIFISGPLPPFKRGCERFSRTLALHTWLQSACAMHNAFFIDNFNLFWNRPSFYRNDGIHPSALGGRILTENMFYTVLNTPLQPWS